MIKAWTLDSLVSSSDGVVACDLDGDSALLNLDTSTYYKLNSVGTLVWKTIESPVSVQALSSVVSSAYDVDAEICARDLDALLASLLEADLIRISDAHVN